MGLLTVGVKKEKIVQLSQFTQTQYRLVVALVALCIMLLDIKRELRRKGY